VLVYIANDSCFPFVGAFVYGELTHADLAAMKEIHRKNRERGRHVSLIDGRRAKMPDAAMRKETAKLMESLKADGSSELVCSAVVIGSSAAAGVLTALQWLVPSRQAIKYFSSAVDALAWVKSKGAPDLALPPSAQSLVEQMDKLIADESLLQTFADAR
jgi:hypothetical protein